VNLPPTSLGRLHKVKITYILLLLLVKIFNEQLLPLDNNSALSLD